jgi:acyl-CoA synthetase (AMP-forming)/AMP-acid ligase II
MVVMAQSPPVGEELRLLSPLVRILPGTLPTPPSNRIANSDSLAFLQYTSGSTAESKGAKISQRAVLRNIDGFAAAMMLDEHSRFSSLLPLFHDMGLVCFGLAPLLLGHTLVLHRQEALSLYQWLDSIGTYRVTHTGGPDSLLRIACRVVEDEGQYDLSSLRMLICGSEPIQAATLEAFGRRFGVGHVLRPAYGMAELTLCATLTPARTPWRKDVKGRVSSGIPIEGVDVKVDRSGDTEWGEILVRSPSRMEAYWGRSNTEELDGEGYLRTGDYGYIDDEGHLYVLGRFKNMLIRGGAKFSPHDLESTVLVLPEVRRAAVVQPQLGKGEQDPIVAVLEVERWLLKAPERLVSIAHACRQACGMAAGLVPDQVWFVSGGQIPTTENGKLRHRALAEAIALCTFRAAWIDPPTPAPQEADQGEPCCST